MVETSYYHRKEKGDDWVVGLCDEHAPIALGHGFTPGPGDLRGLEGQRPGVCAACLNPAFDVDVARCTCVTAPSRCPAHRRR